MEALVWAMAICLLAMSTDIVDWLADKIEEKFKSK